MMKRIALGVLGLLAACTLDPDYDRPAAPVPAAYPQGPAYKDDLVHSEADPAISADAIGWRDFFLDTRLQRLIAIAIANNRDLRVAILDIAQAQAEVRVQDSALFPPVDLTAAPAYNGEPKSTDIPNPSSTAATKAGNASGPTSSIQSTGGGGVYRYYQANLGFTSYELDVFGRLRSLSRAAFETYLSQESQERSTQISLVAEVATAWLTFLADRDLLRLAADTQKSQAESYRLTRRMLDAGTATRLSLRQVEQLMDAAAANVAQDTRQVAQDENALALLLGQEIPSDLISAEGIAEETLLADLPAGLPSELLTRRPDIMAAEHTLLSANADIGAARAAFFPSIMLTGSDGVASNQLNHLFTKAATTWLFAPQITLPIFTWGKNDANLDYAKLQKQIEVANYEKAIQTAFREVADALAARGTYADQLRAEQALAEAAADAAQLAGLRFRTGVDNFLAELDSERTLYSARQTLVTIRQAELTNRVTLYKVLGGGWVERRVPVVPVPR